jgi:hypothetical protein
VYLQAAYKLYKLRNNARGKLIDLIIKNYPQIHTHTLQALMTSLITSTKHLEETLSYSFHEANIILIAKPAKRIKRKNTHNPLPPPW